MQQLLVPITVSAYVTNGKKIDDRYISDITPNFSRLRYTTIGGELDPPPFAIQQPLKAGVHLHFILPDALTHGIHVDGPTQNADESYPIVPNRWLVSRIHKSNTLSVMTWMVESDYESYKRSDSVTLPDYSNDTQRYRYWGRCYPIQNSPTDWQGGPTNLTAIGWGHAAFSAFYPNCASVLGLHDDLSDVPEGDLSYSVIGFYEDKSRDPLHNVTEDNWNSYLSAFEWSLPEGSVPKNEILCHGSVCDIRWRGTSADYPSGTPIGTIDVAMGNSSVEALSALISKAYMQQADKPGQLDPKTMERFLATLQYDLVDELADLDGIAGIQDAIHENGFNSYDGGKKWTVRQSDEYLEEKPSLPKGTADRLSHLNELQDEKNFLSRDCAFDQQAMHSAFYTFMLLYEGDEEPEGANIPDKQTIYDEICRLAKILDQKATRLNTLNQQIEEEKDALKHYVNQNGEYFILDEMISDRFYRPNDPVLMIAGSGVARSYLFGEDGRFTSDGTLQCREEPLEGLSGESGGQPIQIGRTSLLSLCSGVSPAAMDVSGFSEFLCETICLSPAMLAYVQDYFHADSLIPEGTLPSPLAVNHWKQQWNTLFLEWKVHLHSTKTSANPDDTMRNWKLKDIDYTYENLLPLCPQAYTGRSILTPHSTLLLKEVILKYADRYKDQPELYEYLQKTASIIADLNILSQPLSGFNEQLIMKHQTLELPRLNIEPETSPYKDLAAIVNHYVGNQESLALFPYHPFYPIRGGFLEIAELNAISTFGNIQTLFSHCDISRVVTSEEYTPEEWNEANGHGVLRPRITQPARMQVNWISMQDNQLESNADPDTSPVCGFLIPNLLNRGLMVYDVNGDFKGTLKLVYRSGKTEARWLSSPKKTLLPFEEEMFLSPHLKQFLHAILDQNAKKEEAYDAFLHIIDQRLNQIISLENNNSQDISVLWGRPIVLARASMRLELFSKAAYTQQYDEFGMYQSHGFENTPFPVMIGDTSRVQDGTLGFFLDDDGGYNTFYPSAGLKKPVDHQTDYIAYEHRPLLKASDEKALFMTVLLEPKTTLHARSGILPVKKWTLPSIYYSDALAALSMAFDINPLLSSTAEIEIPLLHDENLTWSFLHREGNGYREYHDLVPPTNVFPETPAVIMDGSLLSKKGGGA